MAKLKVSFEITDNYDIEGFRNFIKGLTSNTEQYEVYIISNDDNSVLINTIGTNLGLNEDHIIVCNFTEDKIQAIEDNNINIHLDNLQSVILLVDETTEGYGVLVTPNLNKYYLIPDYVITFDRLVTRIEENE